MYTQLSSFENELVKKAGLLSLLKSDYDLFLIAQAGSITYQQLHYTGIHGHSGVGGRLSLKKLEREKYIKPKIIPNEKIKYYCLTSRGRERVQKLFGEELISELNIDLEKKTPSSQLQLPHRLASNDFYFNYISCPNASVPFWKQEWMYTRTYESNYNNIALPRCDGYMFVSNYHYYIEQDNGTQSEQALETKFKYYLRSQLFRTSKNNILIFTLKSKLKPNDYTHISSYSIYRLILKLYKTWELWEENRKQNFTFEYIVSYLETYRLIGTTKFTHKEVSMIKNLKYKHTTTVSLSDLQQLKNDYLNDKSQEIEQRLILDRQFNKRYVKFNHLVDKLKWAGLKSLFMKGIPIYIIPNHRIEEHMPYIMHEDYNISDHYRKLMSIAGINSYGLNYSSINPFEITEQTIYFRNVFTDDSNHVIFEDIKSDMGSFYRLEAFLNDTREKTAMVFILLVHDKDEAWFFSMLLTPMLEKKANTNIKIGFYDKAGYYHQNSCIYTINNKNIEDFVLNRIYDDREDFMGIPDYEDDMIDFL